MATPDPFYRSREWRRLRMIALRRDAYTCTVPGCRAHASHVDHIIPRKQGGADVLANLRSLCAHHDAQVRERPDGQRAHDGTPFMRGCDVNGVPLDPGHWWRK